MNKSCFITLFTVILAAASLPAFGLSKDIAAAGARIDALVEKNLAANDLVPYPRTTDAIFLRRIYLDLVGRIPTADETVAFLESKNPAKRAELIDTLMHSEGFVAHQFNFWADILRVRTRLSGAGQSASTGHAYAQWIKEAIRKNQPYDEIVRELVSAEGRSWENGAIGYYIRDYGMNLCNSAVTTQIFLGTSVQCAQCHDHPFDKWTQKDFYQGAAYQYNVLTTNTSENQSAAMAILAKDKSKGRDPKYRKDLSRAFSEILKPLRFNNVYHKSRTLTLPHDYQYADAKPKSKVAPAVMFGEPADPKSNEHPIETYARWLSSPDTPRFTKVIANRMWKKVMGIGLYEPVDEIMDHTEASNPELEAFLIKTMVDFDYDLRKFQAMLYNTKAYQRRAHTEDILPGEAYHYPGPLLKRMSAEQVWDSLVTLMVDDPDTPNPAAAFNAEKIITRTRWIAESVYDQAPGEFLQGAVKIAATQKRLAREMQELTEKREAAREAGDVAQVKKFTAEGTRKARELANAVEELVYQRGFEDKVELVSKNAGAKKNAAVAEDDFLTELASCIQDDDIMKKAGGPDSPMTSVVKAVLAEREKVLKSDSEKQRAREWKDWGVKTAGEEKAWYAYNNARRSVVMRAADLAQPAPPGHFLREFGQSDRELVDNANDDASITQALNLLNNSTLYAGLNNPYTVLRRNIKAAKTPEKQVETLYLTLLNRYPTSEEENLLVPVIEADKKTGAMDVAWTLLNTREFMFVQ